METSGSRKKFLSGKIRLLFWYRIKYLIIYVREILRRNVSEISNKKNLPAIRSLATNDYRVYIVIKVTHYLNRIWNTVNAR